MPVRSYDCELDEDIWEQITDLRWIQVLTYCRRRKLQVPDDIDKAHDGYPIHLADQIPYLAG